MAQSSGSSTQKLLLNGTVMGGDFADVALTSRHWTTCFVRTQGEAMKTIPLFSPDTPPPCAANEASTAAFPALFPTSSPDVFALALRLHLAKIHSWPD